ncbi:prepilin peptidase [Amycolatopsis sp. NPDC006125]|uniref:prepilin peptidase n=1 Tax=Amycolatopsis sp. NPDC006125 TaxID=3156730 RepID=UPI0033B9C466
MTITASVTGWAMVGFVVVGAMHAGLRRFPYFGTGTERIAPPAVLELVGAVLFAAMAWRFASQVDLFAYSWFVAVGVLLAALDLKIGRLPTRLLQPGGLALAALFGLTAVVHEDAHSIIRSAAGLLVLLVFYGALYFLLPGHLGGGDLRLGGLLGVALGWAGWTALLYGTLLGWLAAALALLVLRVIREPESAREIPLGPFLIFGALVALLVSPAL